jgi:hypothetical protein
VVEHLPNKHKILNSIPLIAKRKKERKKPNTLRLGVRLISRMHASMHKSLDSIPSTEKKKRKKEKMESRD